MPDAPVSIEELEKLIGEEEPQVFASASGLVKTAGGDWGAGGDRPFKFDPNSTENEGRFRLMDPKLVTDYFRRKSSTPGVSYVMGKFDDGETKIQAIRFDKARFSEEEAAKWYEDNRGGWYRRAQLLERLVSEAQVPMNDPLPTSIRLSVPQEFIGRQDILSAHVTLGIGNRVMVGGILRNPPTPGFGPIGLVCGPLEDWKKTWHNGVQKWLQTPLPQAKKFEEWAAAKFGASKPGKAKPSQPEPEPFELSKERIEEMVGEVPDVFADASTGVVRKTAAHGGWHAKSQSMFGMNVDRPD